MSSFTNLLLIVFIINFCMFLFGVPGAIGTDLTELSKLATNPSNWTDGWQILLSANVMSIAGGITLGLYILTKSDLALLFTAFTLLWAFGAPLGSLYLMISASTHPTVAALIVGPIVIIYAMTVIAWWRGRA